MKIRLYEPNYFDSVLFLRKIKSEQSLIYSSAHFRHIIRSFIESCDSYEIPSLKYFKTDG